jgi:DNA-binding NarL/FixJ family response regulator
MAGGTLVVSRAVNNHLYYKKRFKELGFPDVSVTALEKDALSALIREMKPSLLMMGARFYQSCTPFLMGEMHKTFPNLKMAALCIGEYPAELAMYFILNGVKSYVTSFDGIDQFYKGIEKVSKGGEYVSPAVIERIALRPEYPLPAGNITNRHKEVIRLVCSGFNDTEIAENLQVSRRTVGSHKRDIFTSLNVRSAIELLCAALTLQIITLDELYFYPKDYTLNPQPTVEKPYFIRRRK